MMDSSITLARIPAQQLALIDFLTAKVGPLVVNVSLHETSRATANV